MKGFRQLHPVPSQTEEMFPGLIFHQEVLNLKGRFTNLYWLKIDCSRYRFKIKSYPKPRPLVKYNLSDKKIVAGINFGSFYLTDHGESTQATFCNLLIEKGCIRQFPCNNRTALVNKNEQLTIAKFKPYGKLKIGGDVFKWRGVKGKDKTIENVFYGYFEVRLGEKNKRDLKLNFANCPQRLLCKDTELLVGFIRKGRNIIIKNISKNELDLRDYLFVLKGPVKNLCKLCIGQGIEAFTVGDENCFMEDENVCSGNFRLGKTPEELKVNLNTELVFPHGDKPNPVKQNYKKSWSVILKEENNIVFFINDARPKYKNQKGLDIFELQSVLVEKFDYSWAIVGDGGQSSKLFYCNETRKVFGNLHYLNYETTPPYWDGVRGRFIPTAVLAYE